MHIRRWVIGIIGGALALLVAAVLVVTTLIDPNRFRDEIEQAVYEATGLPFELHGNLDIGWFPWLAVQTGAARLGSPTGAAEPPLIEWESARVGARLVPLLRGRLVIDRIRLQGPRIYLRRTESGSNWDALVSALGNGDTSANRALPELAGLELRDGLLDYVDAQSGTHLRWTGWQLDLGAWNGREPLPVQLQAQLHEPIGAAIRLETRLDLPGTLDRIVLDGTRLDLKIAQDARSDAGVPVRLDIPRISVQRSPLAVAIPELTLRIAEATMVGEATIAESEDGLRAGGPLRLSVPSVRELLENLEIDVPASRNPDVLGPLTATASWTFAKGALGVESIDARIDQTRLTGRVLRPDGPEPVWTVELHADQVDFGQYVDADGRGDEPIERLVEALERLPVQGEITIARARLADANMKNVRLRMQSGEAPEEPDLTDEGR